MVKLVLVIFISNVNLLSQNELLPKKTLKKINEEHSLLKKITYQNRNPTFIDSLIELNINQFDSLIEIAFLIKHDSCYEPKFSELINRIKSDTTDIVLLNTAFELSKFGMTALLNLDNVPKPSKSFMYWRNVVRMIVLGYEFNDLIIEYNPDIGFIGEFGRILPVSHFNDNSILSYERGILQKTLAEKISGKLYLSNQDWFHQFAINTIKKGKVNPTFMYYVIQPIIKQEVLIKENSLLNDYLEIIDVIDLNNALSIIDFISTNRPINFYPQILIELLDNENEVIVTQVLQNSSSCWDEVNCPKVKDKLIRIFNGNSKSLKFLSSFVLMHDYQDSLAYDYLIDQVDLDEYNDRYTAISWLGDVKNHARPMSSKLDSVLFKYLFSLDDRIKRATIETYLRYNSDNVIEALIPFVDYNIGFIADKIVEKIIKYENKAFTKKVIQSY
ncbi:MAG TPA: hypothetical protein PKD51_09520 [Saprospiraceae bacterium]|nr:hypothetical protein [Saprospiraceae bacterium]